MFAQKIAVAPLSLLLVVVGEIRRVLQHCFICILIVMLHVYTSRKEGRRQRIDNNFQFRTLEVAVGILFPLSVVHLSYESRLRSKATARLVREKLSSSEALDSSVGERIENATA